MGKIKLSDYVSDLLVHHDIKDIFTVSGGGIMHLLDSIGKNNNIKYYCNHHEQASAISAEAYTRISKKMGCCLVTTGPGSTNALSGIVGAWYDSIPLLVISGQVKRELIADYNKIRQIACQEVNILEMARPVTKYINTVKSPEMIRYEFEKALSYAYDGRPGPVWLDIPLDVQGSMIEISKLKKFNISNFSDDELEYSITDKIKDLFNDIKLYKRPLLLCGNGVRLASAEMLLKKILDTMEIPVALTLSAKDLIPENHPMYIGIVGHVAQRRANFALQNCDLLISIGSGLNTAKVGFNYNNFAAKAKKIIIDIDNCQLTNQVVIPDIAIQADAKKFLEKWCEILQQQKIEIANNWKTACKDWKINYQVKKDAPESDPNFVNSYVFFDKLSNLLEENDIVITGNGLECPSCFQAFKVKNGQRVIFNTNYGSMGWGLPASIGACVGAQKRKVICVTGDGSIQMNLQELQTISYYHLPVKLFVFNNQGYASIRATQNNFFKGHLVGADITSGVSNPIFEFIAKANKIPFEKIKNNNEIEEKIKNIYHKNGPMLCEVNIWPNQEVSPKCTSYTKDDGTIGSRQYEDMSPILSREEIYKNMHLFE